MNHSHFVKNLFALQKTLDAGPTEFSRMTGKHRDVLKNWNSKKTSPTSADIAHVCKRLSKELAERKRVVGFIVKGSSAIESFVTESIEQPFRSKKVTC